MEGWNLWKCSLFVSSGLPLAIFTWWAKLFLFKKTAFITSSGLLFACLFFFFFSFSSLDHVPVPTRAYVSFHLPGWSTRESWPTWSTRIQRKDGISRTSRASRPESSVCSLPTRPYGPAWPHRSAWPHGVDRPARTVEWQRSPNQKLETVCVEGYEQ